MGKPMSNNYIVYGRKHEQELKEHFRKEMFTAFYSNWLYNGASAKTVADLGYFMGYAICKAYYQRASDKKKAIRQIIELDYSNEREVEKFLKRSGYYTERIDQKALIREFEARRPSVVRLEPFNNGDMAVDPSIQEMKIIFSVPMNKKSISINYGNRGKDYSPIAGIGGFSEDGTSFTIKLSM